MAKIVYNACYGGFSLSHEAIMRYHELIGTPVYPEKDAVYPGLALYWYTKPEDRVGIKEGKDFYKMSMEERQAYNKACSEQLFYDRDINRADPFLAQVVEELGEKANGPFADLRISELESGTRYRIDEYDGLESIMTIHDYEWMVA